MGWINDIIGSDIVSNFAALGRRKAINFGRSLRVVDDAANERANVGNRWPSVGPVAWAQWHVSGTSVIVDAHEESWNVPGTGVAPAIARTSAGVYTVTYPSTYVDEFGVTQAMALRFGIAAPTGVTSGSLVLSTIAIRTSGAAFRVEAHEPGSATTGDGALCAFFW